MIDDPIGCGFLLQYCIRQYSDENIRFIVDVSRFREVFAHIDPDGVVSSLEMSWCDIDARLREEASQRGSP
jgi:hypothetical protein